MTRILAYPDDDYTVDKPPVEKVWCTRCGLHAAPQGHPQLCPSCNDRRDALQRNARRELQIYADKEALRRPA